MTLGGSVPTQRDRAGAVCRIVAGDGNVADLHHHALGRPSEELEHEVVVPRVRTRVGQEVCLGGDGRQRGCDDASVGLRSGELLLWLLTACGVL